GQVALLRSEDAFTLLQKRLSGPRSPRTLSVPEAAARLTGYQPPSPVSPPPSAPPEAGRPPSSETRLFRYEGLRRVETATLWPEPDVAVPGACFTWRVHSDPSQPLLWLDGEGVAAAQQRDVFRGLLAELLPQRWLVLAVDVRGIGET